MAFGKMSCQSLLLGFALAAGIQVPGVAVSALTAGSGNAAESPVDWTLVEMRPSVSPQLFRGADGKYNLVYEVVLTNYSKSPVSLEEFEVVNADSGQSVLKLVGPQLACKVTQRSGVRGLRLGAGQSATVWVNVELPSAENTPRRLSHRLRQSGKNIAGLIESKTLAGGDSEVIEKPVLVIASPLRGGKWAAFGGYCGTMGHRRTLYPIGNGLYSAQRYAIDWIRIDDSDYTFKGNCVDPKNSVSYGEPILAVADGTVYGVVNNFQNQVPNKPTGTDRYSYPAGNSITLDLGNGHFGMYAHLAPGSITVKPGDKVKRGDVIAKLGNSGNTTGPHLHFHVTDDPHVLQSNGVPYVFDKFDVVGEVGNMQQFFRDDAACKLHKLEHSKFDGAHKEELVPEGYIVRFPEMNARN